MADLICAYSKKHKVIEAHASVLHEGFIIRVPVQICVDKECVARRGGTRVMNATGPNPHGTKDYAVCQ